MIQILWQSVFLIYLGICDAASARAGKEASRNWWVWSFFVDGGRVGHKEMLLNTCVGHNYESRCALLTSFEVYNQSSRSSLPLSHLPLTPLQGKLHSELRRSVLPCNTG